MMVGLWPLTALPVVRMADRQPLIPPPAVGLAERRSMYHLLHLLLRMIRT